MFVLFLRKVVVVVLGRDMMIETEHNMTKGGDIAYNAPKRTELIKNLKRKDFRNILIMNYSFSP